MAWYAYITGSGEVDRHSLLQFNPLEPGYSQVENPTVTALDGPRVYDIGQNEIRIATQLEQDAFPAARTVVDLLSARASGNDILVTSISDLGQVVRALAIVTKDEINILREQFNTTTDEVQQLTTTTFNPRTNAQIKSAIANIIDTEQAD